MSSSSIEKRDIFFGAGAAGCGAVAVALGVALLTLSPLDVMLLIAAAGLASFLLVTGVAFFLVTERGLNIRGFPTSFTSSSGFCPSGIDGVFLGAGRLSPEVTLDEPVDDAVLFSSVPSFSFASPPLLLTNAGSAPVFRLIPRPRPETAGLELDAAVFVADDAAAFFGGGRKDPKLLNLLPPPPPAVLARFADGCPSSAVSALAAGRLTTILPLSRSFWKGFLDVAPAPAVDEVVAGAMGFCETWSESESESE